MSRRSAAAALVLALWLAGLGLLVRREYFRPRLEQLAEGAVRVSPGVVFFGVMQGAAQVGFASSTVDTSTTAITIADYLVADIPSGGNAHRVTARTNVALTRSMRLTTFGASVESVGTALHVVGHADGDSTLVVSVFSSGDMAAATRRLHVTGPVFLPSAIPLTFALGGKPIIGKRYRLPVFDPATVATREVGLRVTAESLFVLDDSAAFDSSTGRWRGARPDTLQAWQVATDSPAGFAGWVDEQGRVVEMIRLGLILHRVPYEMAFLNWRAQVGKTDPPSARAHTRVAPGVIRRRIRSSGRPPHRHQASSLRGAPAADNDRGFQTIGSRPRMAAADAVLSSPTA